MHILISRLILTLYQNSGLMLFSFGVELCQLN